ncbi:hypothetical protein B0H63DRAFT_505983 [Podospora didyma]|uniref:Uncharacterized protein n=1 Tax=Podospora didyma TaxID=330526 RepID=A0AAE0U7V5_9PEZI|nr:hypothetical protein B0H63DRAFT_505983 [Podospora didyma]
MSARVDPVRTEPEEIAAGLYDFHSTSKNGKLSENGFRSTMERGQKLLDESPEIKAHPLLMVGVFAELQRDRLDGLVQDTVYEQDEFMTDLVSNADLKSAEARRSLTRDQQGGDFATSTRRFTNRLEEICNDLDSMVNECRISYEELTFTRDLFMAELSRQDASHASQEAEETRKTGSITNRQAKVSTAIAFVAMMYLPMASVAVRFYSPDTITPIKFLLLTISIWGRKNKPFSPCPSSTLKTAGSTC